MRSCEARIQAEAAQRAAAEEDERKQISQSDFCTSLVTHAHLVTPINLLDSPLRAKKGRVDTVAVLRAIFVRRDSTGKGC